MVKEDADKKKEKEEAAKKQAAAEQKPPAEDNVTVQTETDNINLSTT